MFDKVRSLIGSIKTISVYLQKLIIVQLIAHTVRGIWTLTINYYFHGFLFRITAISQGRQRRFKSSIGLASDIRNILGTANHIQLLVGVHHVHT